MKIKGHISNVCSCTEYDMDTMQNVDAEWCDQTCWYFAIEDFENCVMALFDRETMPDGKYPFKVEGIPLWNRTVGGVACVNNAEDLIRAMTVNSEWTLEWEFDNETMELGGRLSHHDGTGWVTVSPMSVEDAELALT